MRVRRQVLAGLTGLLLAVGTVPAAGSTGAADTVALGPAPLDVSELRVDGLSDPLGIDDTTPKLSWKLTSDATDQRQSAYQVQAATSAQLLAAGEPDLWDSGKVDSPNSTNVAYEGEPLTSRTRVYWRARVWDADGRMTSWSDVAHWEMGLLDESDWQAQWIGNDDWLNREPTPITIDVGARDAQYLRITTTELGLPYTEAGNLYHRLQLTEVGVTDSAHPGVNLVAGAAVTSSDPTTYPGWEPRFLTDGSVTSARSPFGYSSGAHSTADPGEPIVLTFDLGEVAHFDTVSLYPRTDISTEDGRTPYFPRDFTVEAAGADEVYTVVAKVDDQKEPPAFLVDRPALPIFAKQFQLTKPVRSARLYATGLGIYDATVNGQPISDAVLQPGNTDYDARIPYTVNDVTPLLERGPNSLAIRMGSGIADVPRLPDRFTKWSGSVSPPKLIAQLEVTYADGSTERIDSDASWRTTLGPTTLSHWYGGEDYDARRLQPGWDRPSADLSGWDAAQLTGPPTETAELTAQMAPTIQPVDRLETVAITEPKPGTYVFDLGTNVAGWPVLNIEGPRGTTVTLEPGERLLDNGIVDRSTMLSGGRSYPPTLDHYTLAGTGPETWHPRFIYHGFRYIQVTGLPGEPRKDMIEAIVLRAANAKSGDFDSSSYLYDSIHRLINRSIQGNMYSVLTDCPNREKLGWLEEVHLQFTSIARNYDVQAYYADLTRTIAEAQQPDGSVPAIAPLVYLVFGGAADNRNEPNWGSALINAPWHAYRTYGDVDTLRTYYPNMQAYLDYLTSRAEGHIVDYGLGDWGAFDTSTLKGITGTFGYFRAAQRLGEIASVLGESEDAARYQQLADDIGDAFHATFFDAENHTYGTGSQASDAFALDMGVVPDEERAAVLDHLLTSLRANDDYVTVGEIALPSLLTVLSDAHRDDVIYAIASKTKAPSYGYQVVNGATALPEYWDGATGYGSQNHFMMGAIEEWFSSRLAGIGQQDDSVGYRDLLISPRPGGGLTHAGATYDSPYGEVASRWRMSDRDYVLDVTVPPNATARIEVPTWDGQGDARSLDGATKVDSTDHATVFEVGSGHWRFVSRMDEPVPEDVVQLAVQGPDATIPAVEGYPSTARFEVHNLMDHPVWVRPQVSASEGFRAESPGRIQLPPHRTTPVDIAVTRTANAPAEGELSFMVDDQERTVRIEATDNLARLASMSASSTHSKWSPSRTNDGKTEAQGVYDIWNSGNGWNDGTSRAFPDWLRADWANPVTLSKVVVLTVDSDRAPAVRYGLRDYQVQVLVDGEWTTVVEVSDSTAATVTSTFDPVRVSGLRVLVTDSNDHSYSRVVEVEAYESQS